MNKIYYLFISLYPANKEVFYKSKNPRKSINSSQQENNNKIKGKNNDPSEYKFHVIDPTSSLNINIKENNIAEQSQNSETNKTKLHENSTINSFKKIPNSFISQEIENSIISISSFGAKNRRQSKLLLNQIDSKIFFIY